MFFFQFHRQQEPRGHCVDCQAIIRRLSPFGSPDKSGFLETDRTLLVQCVNWNTATSTLEPAPFHDPQTGVAVVSWARIDNREELAEALGLAAADLLRLCDSELIVCCYLKWGEECIHHLIGDFVFALYDEKKNKVFCGRDHFGVRPFYYFLSRDRFVCATSLSALVGLEGIPIELDGQWLAEYLNHLSMSFDKTPYRGILKLPPAHCLTVTPENLLLRRYFELVIEPTLLLKDSREYVEAYREQLEIAINCRLTSDYPIGSELSGGLDSSTVTAFSAKMLSPALECFHAFAFALYELEPQYILAVSRAWKLPYSHIVTAWGADWDQTKARALAVLGYPEEHANGSGHEPFYQLAEKFNIRTLLSGFGGDEFVTTIHGYLVPLELLVQNRLRELYSILPGNVFMRFLRLGRQVQKRIQTRNFTKQQYNPRFLQAFSRRWPHQLVRQELVTRFDLENRYMDTARFDAGYTDLKKFTLEKRWVSFVPTRLENCTLMAAARKIEYRWPLLDVRLVKLFLRIPSQENYHRGMGRYLHRRAVAGVVPDLIAWKQSKDMGAIPGLFSNEDGDCPQLSIGELHSDLVKLIDTEKLGRQLEDLTQRKDWQDQKEYWFQVRRNIGALKQLNLWLKGLPPGFRIDL